MLPKGFHRIRHYGLFASTNRAESIARARALLHVAPPTADPQEQPDVAPHPPRVLPYPCPCCGARMIVIETFAPGCQPSWRAAGLIAKIESPLEGLSAPRRRRAKRHSEKPPAP